MGKRASEEARAFSSPFGINGFAGRNKNRATLSESRDQLKTKVPNAHGCVKEKLEVVALCPTLLFSEIREERDSEALAHGRDDLRSKPLRVLLKRCRFALHLADECGVRDAGQVDSDIQESALDSALEQDGRRAGVGESVRVALLDELRQGRQERGREAGSAHRDFRRVAIGTLDRLLTHRLLLVGFFGQPPRGHHGLVGLGVFLRQMQELLPGFPSRSGDRAHDAVSLRKALLGESQCSYHFCQSGAQRSRNGGRRPAAGGGRFGGYVSEKSVDRK